MTIQPITSTVSVKAPPAKAFDLFANGIGTWWPAGRTPGKLPFAEIIIEPRAGGRWFERDAEGGETRWGTVLDWSPPHRLLLGWQLDTTFVYDANLMTEVELTFVDAEGGGSTVTLEHRDLEKFGVEAEKMAASLGGGWAGRLVDYADHVNATA